MSACHAGRDATAPAIRPNAAAQAALDTILFSEREGESRYVQVLRAFGKLSPFDHLAIAKAERVAALEELYASWGAAPPANPFKGAAQPAAAYPSLSAACAESTQDVLATLARYEHSLALDPPPAVARLWRVHRARAQGDELPAVQRCR